MRKNGIEPEIVDYLNTPLDADALKSITTMLGCSIQDIVRTGEDIFYKLGLKNTSASEDELIDIVVNNPLLLQRPIVVNNNKAVIGRPPENVLAIL